MFSQRSIKNGLASLACPLYPSKETSADARFTTKKSRHDGLALGDLFAAGLASAPGAFGELRNDTTSQ
jgi:hypothetical protein